MKLQGCEFFWEAVPESEIRKYDEDDLTAIYLLLVTIKFVVMQFCQIASFLMFL